MATFIVIQTVGDSGFDESVPKRFGERAFRLPNGDWLVAFPGTSEQLANELGIVQDETNNAVVLRFTAYWGRATPDTWAWMRENGDFG
uniref:Uncharacterized protein n=1 Tax=Candidatus Kentrum sp. SD TaxID=2126332 RepID=A0A451BIQ2_9GAMM|nr:MAG: hypothetical protein BECKSD772F_GA0070984_10756 [Candidatus Kentron sp. SD]VFK46664.1 MAG: hypothetical protein BECKSD772E_GA0070983_10786 [Candidatus Kentron sp. SD]VFK78173.1 MAG: hypothetical protein BECKSD772D_GA0070982_100844 [Candidatus Kentron sp. SD]